MTRDQIFEFFRRLAEDNPAPETELEYGNAYQLVVAVALSAQATDVGVNKATRALFAMVETPQQMLDLGEDLLAFRRGEVTVVLNCGSTPAPLPTGEVVISSGPVTDTLPGDTAVWLR